METIVLVLAISAVNAWCFLLGAKVSQTVLQGEKVQLPTVDPLNAYRQHQSHKQAQEEKSKLDAIMRNLDNYDGTGFGQEDIPGGG